MVGQGGSHSGSRLVAQSKEMALDPRNDAEQDGSGTDRDGVVGQGGLVHPTPHVYAQQPFQDTTLNIQDTFPKPQRNFKLLQCSVSKILSRV